MRKIKDILIFALVFYFSAYSNGRIENTAGAEKIISAGRILRAEVLPPGAEARSDPGQITGKVKYVPREMSPGEEITYVVKYAMIKLGEIRLKVLEKKEMNGQIYYRTKAYIDSYPGVPFVSLHQIYESNFNVDQYSNFFRSTEKEKDYIKYTEYYFDYRQKRVFVKKGKYRPDQVWTDSSAAINQYYQDGLSLFYYARLNTGIKKTVNVPCFVTEEFVYTKINFYNDIQNIEIDAVDHPIPCTRLDGHTDFVSIFGLTGNFEGYFTDDAYAVPTVAKMKVIIGNITLELKEWRIGNWKPPQNS